MINTQKTMRTPKPEDRKPETASSSADIDWSRDYATVHGGHSKAAYVQGGRRYDSAGFLLPEDPE